MTKRFCDSCGKQIDDYVSRFRVVIERHAPAPATTTLAKGDVCARCVDRGDDGVGPAARRDGGSLMHPADLSRASGAAFLEDREKQKTCKHPRLDKHRSTACPDCNLVQWAAVSDGSFALGLKQAYFPSDKELERMFKR